MHQIARLSTLPLAGALLLLCGCADQKLEAMPTKYVGIGVELTMEAAGARVLRVLPDSPAGTAGVKKDDVLLEVRGETTRGRPLAEVVQDLRGRPGTSIAVLARTRDGNRRFSLLRRSLHDP